MAGWFSSNDPDRFSMELIVLPTSILMVAGVWQMRGLFLEMREVLLRQRHLADIIEQTSDMVGSMDTHYQLRFLNRAGRQIMGIGESADLSAYRMHDFHPPEAQRMLVEEALPAALSEGTWSGEGEMIVPDASRRWAISLVIIAHRDVQGRVKQFSAIIRDISACKQVERQLRELNESRERLLAILAHDLRGPMGSCLARARVFAYTCRLANWPELSFPPPLVFA